MLLTGLLFVSVVACGQAWILEASETRVAKNMSTNLTISCRYDGKNGPKNPAANIFRIRLQKFQKETHWNTVAKISTISQKVTTTFADVQTSGFAGKSNDSFLTLHFDIATENSIGLFQCEVDWIDNDRDLRDVKSNLVNIYERGVNLDDFLNIILKLKTTKHTDHNAEEFRIGLLVKAVRLLESQGNSRASVIAGVQQTMKATKTKVNNFEKRNDDFDTDLKYMQTDLRSTNDDWKTTITMLRETNANMERISNDLKKIHTELDILGKAVGYVSPWPEGAYALLNTSSGCPTSDTVDWKENNALLATQKGDTNRDNTSTPIHLSENPIQKRGDHNVFSFSFCSKSVISSGPRWPKGKYCFNNFGWGNCPLWFLKGYIRIDTENVKPLPNQNFGGVYFYTNFTQMMFCCRLDGDPNHPVILPNKSPFYLYRFGGVCQQVRGMDVSNEWIYLDTYEKKDKYIYNYPDGQIRNVRMELCYYTPNK